MAKRKVAQTETVADVRDVQTPAQPFWEKYQQYLPYAVGAIVLIVAGWWGYKSLIVAPQQKKAEAAMWQAQQQFDRDSFNLALNNPGGGAEGFLTIIDQYGSTPAGNLARYYAGVCYMHLGQIDNAIQYLESFDAEGDLLPIMKNGLLGDAWSEKQDYAKALDYYADAVDAGNNDVLSAYYLKKVGMLNEYQGNKEAALKAYQRLKKDFPNANSSEWQNIDKYIYRTGGGQQ